MWLRAVMRKHGAGFETVQKALISALPEPRKMMEPRETRLDPYKPVIDGILTADLTAPRKQRHTVKRIYAQVSPADRAGHRGRDGRLPGQIRAGDEAGQRAR